VARNYGQSSGFNKSGKKYLKLLFKFFLALKKII
jgi:hypothetical protein